MCQRTESALVTEFKQLSALSSDEQKEKAINQISGYLLGISEENGEEIPEGLVADREKGCFVTCINNAIVKENFVTLIGYNLDRVTQNILFYAENENYVFMYLLKNLRRIL